MMRYGTWSTTYGRLGSNLSFLAEAGVPAPQTLYHPASTEHTQSNCRNSPTVRPASCTISPIVKALTGLCLGMVTNRRPSDVTTCLPWRIIANPAFRASGRSKVVGARKMLHRLYDHFHLTHWLAFKGVSNRSQVFPDGVLYISNASCSVEP